LKPELPWEGKCLEAASIIHRNGRLYMFYAGAHNAAPQQIGVATSTDGAKWTRLLDEPFLCNGMPGEWNSSESGRPAIFDDGDRSFLFFQGNSDQGRTWWISNVQVFWNEKGPFLQPSDEHRELNPARLSDTNTAGNSTAPANATITGLTPTSFYLGLLWTRSLRVEMTTTVPRSPSSISTLF
jgi:hypothetical protein